MNKKYLNWKKLAQVMIIVVVIEALFLLGAFHQINYKSNNQAQSVTDENVGEITDGVDVVQTFKYNGDYINKISIKAGTYERNNSGTVSITLTGDGKKIADNKFDVSKVENNKDIVLKVNKRVDDKYNRYKLTISGSESTKNDSITLYSNSKGNIHDGKLSVNNKSIDGELEMTVYGDNIRYIGKFWPIFFAVFILIIAIFYCVQKKRESLAKKSILHNLFYNLERYHFLIKQLVSRDFKTKYKRSVLGFFWSFLNPLMTMLVQYAVFSTIFRANIENYPVYLLSATVLFSFFTEAVGGGLGSIVFNAPLIKKVYVPKYIYPVSKVLSTAINLCISLVPLAAVILITGELPNKAYILIPFVLVCLIVFCIGMSLILSSLMVFFRDVQFLWSIISLLWMYATPMFYPEDIIPKQFHFVLTLNPMYHYISFFRTIVLEGTSPQMVEYVYCLGFSVVICGIGAAIFNRTQKKFVLYL